MNKFVVLLAILTHIEVFASNAPCDPSEIIERDFPSEAITWKFSESSTWGILDDGWVVDMIFPSTIKGESFFRLTAYIGDRSSPDYSFDLLTESPGENLLGTTFEIDKKNLELVTFQFVYLKKVMCPERRYVYSTKIVK